MEAPASYCAYVAQLDESNVHRVYHDTQYGFPIDSDDELFARLILEINQAGLSWTTILNKQEHFRQAYSLFSIQKVANYNEQDRKRLLNDSGVIRNKLKINAAIVNAQKILELQKDYGSFKQWLNEHHPMVLDSWVKLFKQTFKFMGREITKEFLMSTGYLEGAHIDSCYCYQEVKKQNPMWVKNS